MADSLGFVPGYIPPIPVETRVRLLVPYSGLEVGHLGTVTWTHPFVLMPYRVKWDGTDGDDIGFGMDDIGWLHEPSEIEPVVSFYETLLAREPLTGSATTDFDAIIRGDSDPV